MKWIEIIKVRGTEDSDIRAVRDMLQDFVKIPVETKPTTVKLYYHSTVKNDLSIHIRWNLETMIAQKSSLGLRIAVAISDLGMVNHSVWIEDTIT